MAFVKRNNTTSSEPNIDMNNFKKWFLNQSFAYRGSLRLTDAIFQDNILYLEYKSNSIVVEISGIRHNYDVKALIPSHHDIFKKQRSSMFLSHHDVMNFIKFTRYPGNFITSSQVLIYYP